MSIDPLSIDSPPQQAPFSFAVSRALGVVVVTVHGGLDGSGCAVLRAVLADLIDGQGNLSVVVDAHDMTVDDPSCLGVLVVASGWAGRRGGELTLADPSPSLVRALQAADLTSAIAVGHRRPRALGPRAYHPSTTNNHQGAGQ